MYSYGDNTNGQLGRDSQLNGRRSALVRGALQPLFVSHVAAGLSHTLAIARPRGDQSQGEESEELPYSGNGVIRSPAC